MYWFDARWRQDIERFALYGRTNDVWCIGRYFEGSNRVLFQTVYPKFPRHSWEHHEKHARIVRVSNWVLPNTIIFLPLAGIVAHLWTRLYAIYLSVHISENLLLLAIISSCTIFAWKCAVCLLWGKNSSWCKLFIQWIAFLWLAFRHRASSI